MQHDANDVDLTIIGYSQAGKTTLAVGLYATSMEELTVTGVGEDTRNYLLKLKAAMDSGKWPDATDERQLPELHLAINRMGRPPVQIQFKEYMGERAVNLDNYKRDVVGDPRGVIILLNPAMTSLRDAEQRNIMLKQIEELIAYLSEPGRRCRYIAFVVTASDLLTKLPQDQRAEFASYKDEIVNCLNTNPFFHNNRWKEFLVTVSGELEDQSRPRIARGDGNTAHRPFVWLLDQLEQEERASGMLRRVRQIATTLLTVSALAGGFFSWSYFWHDRRFVREVDRVLAQSQELDQALQKKDQIGINRACKAMEDGRKNLTAGTPWFSSNQSRLKDRRKLLDQKIEDSRLVWYPGEIARYTNSVVKADEKLSRQDLDRRIEELDDFDKKLAAFKCSIVGNSNRHEQVCRQWRAARIGAEITLDRCHGEWLRAKVKDLAGKADELASEENCKKLRDDIEQWSVKEGNRQIKAELLQTVTNSLAAWRGKYETRNYVKKVGELSEKLQAMVAKEIDRKELHDRLLDCRRYEQWAEKAEAAPLIEFKVRTQHWQTLQPLRQRLLDKFRDDLLKQECYGVNAAKSPAESAHEARKSLADVLQLGDALAADAVKAWFKMFDDAVCKADQAWVVHNYRKGVEGLLGKLRESAKSVGDGEALHECLLGCRKYAKLAESKDAAPLIDFETRKADWQRLRQLRQQALDKFLEEQLKREIYSDRAGRPPKESAGVERKALEEILQGENALVESEAKEWWGKFNAGIDKAQEAWLKEQKRRYEEFLGQLKSESDGYQIVHSLFPNFYSENVYNPYLQQAIREVHSRIGTAFAEIRNMLYTWNLEDFQSLAGDEKQKRVKDGYNKLRELCGAMARVRCEALKKSCWYDFALKCRERGCGDRDRLESSFPQTLTVRKIEVMQYKDEEEEFDLQCSLRTYDWKNGGWTNVAAVAVSNTGMIKLKNSEWTEVWSGIATLRFNPWNWAYLGVNVEQEITGANARLNDKFCIDLHHGKCHIANVGNRKDGQEFSSDDYRQNCFERNWSLKKNSVLPDEGGFKYRVYVQWNGDGLLDIWPSEAEQRFE